MFIDSKDAGARHARPAGVPRSQEYPPHGALHRAGADEVQGLLALISARDRSGSELEMAKAAASGITLGYVAEFPFRYNNGFNDDIFGTAIEGC